MNRTLCFGETPRTDYQISHEKSLLCGRARQMLLKVVLEVGKTDSTDSTGNRWQTYRRGEAAGLGPGQLEAQHRGPGRSIIRGYHL